MNRIVSIIAAVIIVLALVWYLDLVPTGTTPTPPTTPTEKTQ